MKKLFSLILGVGLIFGIAGQSMAAMDDTGEWDNNDLIIGIFNEDYEGDETVINLGDISGIDFTKKDVVLSSGEIDIADWNNLRMGVVGYEMSSYTPYFATTNTMAPGVTLSGYNSFNSNMQFLYRGFTGLDSDADNIVVHSATDGGSEGDNWGALMEQKYTVPGSYAGINNDFPNGQGVLDSLNGGGYVDMYLYKYAGIVNLDNDDDDDATTPWIGVIRLYDDGTVVLNPVPIPGSLLLLGSGLLGLFGIRRKNA